MDTCQHCGTVLPAGSVGGPYCPNCGALVAADRMVPVGATGEHDRYGHGGGYDRPGADLGASQTHLSAPTAALAPPAAPFAMPDPTAAYPPVPDPTAAYPPVPAGADQAEDPYEAYFRPPPGVPSPHTMTQVIPVQPGYDQPIDYRPGTAQAYPEQYEDPYGDGYQHPDAEPPRSSRAAKIGVGAAAAAVLVIIVSLVTIGGGKSTPPTAAGPTEVVSPTTPDEQPSAVLPPPGSSPATPPSASPTTHVPGQLQLGDAGPDVKWLQARLKQLNLYPGQVTGTFDAATQAAVKAFQARAHTADPAGVVGRSTKTALIAWGSRPKLSVLTPEPGKKPRNGQPSADDVKRLQHALSTAIGQEVKATGTFDAATMGAVMQYEVQVGLMPDGAVGDKVWSALQQGKLKP